MNIIILLPLLAAIAYIPLVVITAYTRPWLKQHLFFIMFLISGMLWSAFSFLLRSNLFPDEKLLIFRLDILALLLMITQFYSFVRYYSYRDLGWGTYLSYASLIAVGIGSLLGIMPESLSAINGTVAPVLGIWFIPIVVVPLILAISLLLLLFKKYRNSTDPSERNRIIYFVIVVSLLCIFGTINSTPLGDNFPTGQIGQLANAALLTYATLKFKILDMNLVIRRGFVYAAMSIICLGVFSGWLLILQNIFNLPVNTMNSLGAGILTCLTVAAFWGRTLNFFFHKVDEIFYGESYDYRQALSTFVRREITRVFSLEELCKGLLPNFVKILGCKHVYLLLAESSSNNFVAKYIEPDNSQTTPFVIRQDGPIAKWLSVEKRYLSIANIDVMPEFRSLWKKEKDQIKALEIELFFPFISRGNLIGILALSKKTSRKYTLDETNLVEEISSQIAISIEKELIQAELRKSEQELHLINRLAAVMTSSLNINEVYDAFVDGLREVMDIDFALVALIEENELYITALYSDVGSAWRVGEKIKLKGSATEWIIRHKKSFYEPDLEQDKMFYTGSDYLKRGIHSIVYLPLITKGEGIGSLIIATKVKNAYNSTQLLLLDRLAAQISTSVANAQLFARAEKRARVDELTSLFNRRHFDESIKHEIHRHSRYGNMLSLAFLDLDNFKAYNDSMGHPTGDKLLMQIGKIIRSCLRTTDLAFRYGGDEFSILMPHTSAEDAFGVAERIRVKISSQTRSSNFMITTSIGISSWPNDGLTSDDLVNAADKALYYSKQTGGNRTCLVSQMVHSSGDSNLDSLPTSEKETLNTIYALSATIEARDPYTYGHSRKVRAYAVALAERMNLPSDKVAVISHAALLHDIGKIGVIDEILKKKGKLDANEQQSIRYHPQLSKTIVGHVSSLTPCLPGILYHHERYDGGGYPSGLKGEEIPLEARILSIADSFDAMTSLRPYRAPLTYKEAINELKLCAGTQFDPYLVEMFIPIALTINPEEVESSEQTATDKIN